MEMTLASALSPGGLVGHLAYLLLVVSMLMRSMVRLRILVIASSLTAILYAGVWLSDPVSVFWETLLVAVNIGQLGLIWLQNRQARFTDEESAFAETRLRGLSAGDTRALLDKGAWRSLARGEVLTREGQRPEALTYLSTGAAAITVADRTVALCGAGRYVGEMALIDDSEASATAVVEAPARVWQITAATLSDLRDRRPTLAAVIDAGIARDMRAKIRDANAAGALQD
jgi:hypothetical protein